jgi:hypothetical protein
MVRALDGRGEGEGGGREWEGVDVVGVAWGRQGCVQARDPECPRPFSLFHWVAECIVYCKEEGVKANRVKALFALRAPCLVRRNRNKCRLLYGSMSEGRAVQEKGKEGNLPQKASRKWLK